MTTHDRIMLAVVVLDLIAAFVAWRSLKRELARP